jgi:hypothetical protein
VPLLLLWSATVLEILTEDELLLLLLFPMALSFRTPLSFKDQGREVGVVIIIISFFAFACMGMPLVVATNTIEKNIENTIRVLDSNNNNNLVSALCMVCYTFSDPYLLF